MDHSSQHFRTPNAAATPPPWGVAFSQQLADLRREIEEIKELNMIYRYRKPHRHQDQVAHEKRKARLGEIVRQLAVIRPNSQRTIRSSTPYTSAELGSRAGTNSPALASPSAWEERSKLVNL
jgi:hypothetical protein